MDQRIDDLCMKIILKLLCEREKQTKDELKKLEDELRTENRFFPQNRIIEIIDKLADAPHKKLNKESIIYRARTIDKYHEEKFFNDFINDVYVMIKEVLPEFNEKASNYEWLKVYEYQYRNGKKTILSNEQMNCLYNKYSKKAWWGYCEKESDAPPIEKASDGRINPKGISYLYASDNIYTAALEVRPVVSQYVSIAEIEVIKDIKLFDFTVNYEFQDAQKYFEQSVDWTVLGEYFSQPNYSGEAAYLATQYISEYIKHLKDEEGKNVFDGLCFKSSLDQNGLNYVLFDVSDNKKYAIKNSSVYQVIDLLGNLQLQLPLILEN